MEEIHHWHLNGFIKIILLIKLVLHTKESAIKMELAVEQILSVQTVQPLHVQLKKMEKYMV